LGRNDRSTRFTVATLSAVKGWRPGRVPCPRQGAELMVVGMVVRPLGFGVSVPSDGNDDQPHRNARAVTNVSAGNGACGYSRRRLWLTQGPPPATCSEPSRIFRKPGPGGSPSNGVLLTLTVLRVFRSWDQRIAHSPRSCRCRCRRYQDWFLEWSKTRPLAVVTPSKQTPLSYRARTPRTETGVMAVMAGRQHDLNTAERQQKPGTGIKWNSRRTMKHLECSNNQTRWSFQRWEQMTLDNEGEEVEVDGAGRPSRLGGPRPKLAVVR